MVCVAAIALASSTYAWFVSNNKVTAQTTQIKAQSNTAFMSIVYGTGDDVTAVGSKQTMSTEWYNEGNDIVALYPAKVEKDTDASAKFVTGYGTDIDDGTLNGNYINVGDAATAVTNKYAIGAAENYKISSAGVDLSDLVIDKVEVTAGLNNALASYVRVLVVGPDSWQVWKAGDNKETGLVLEKETGKSLATTVEKDKDTKISVYVYYDGDDKEVNTENLSELEKAVGVTISFSATQPINAPTA